MGLVWSLLLMLASGAYADGIAWQERVPESLTAATPRFPSQRAVLKWDGNEETMIVETTVAGPKGEYGWVVPLPKKPSFVKAVRPEYVEGTFLQVQPKIKSLPPEDLRWLGALAFVGSGLFLTAGFRYRKFDAGMRVLCFFGELFALVLGTTVLMVLQHGGPTGAAMEDRAAMALGASHAKSLSVESLGTIGAYEVSVLSGPDGQEAFDWLQKHHITLPSDGRAVMEQYAKEGWVFLAAELHKNEDGPLPPHPLKAVFTTDHLVYPMRLTGTQDQPIFLELVVVSDKRADVDGMESWSCRNDRLLVSMPQMQTSQQGLFSEWHDSTYAMAKDQAAVTYLRGEISPASMRRDFDVRWSPYVRYEPDVYDSGQARGHEAALFLQAVLGFTFVFGLAGLAMPSAALKMAIVGALASVIGASVVPYLWSRGIRTLETTSDWNGAPVSRPFVPLRE